MIFKSLTNMRKQGFSKTVCIVAGGPHMDLVGSNIMSQIRAAEPKIRFIGIGGTEMQSQGLEGGYADVNSFLNKPLYPYKSFKHKHIERPVHPVFGVYHHYNRKVRDQIDKSNFFEEVMDAEPDAFICLQNDFFMNRLYNYLNELYDFHNVVKPPVFHFDRTHINQRQEFTEWLDHQFSVNPMQAELHSRYTFPHTVVGFEGIGRAWQFLYSQNTQFQTLASQNHIYLSPENNREIMENLIAEERVRFRQNAGLSENQHLIFVAPGNTQSDLDFMAKSLKNGIPEFLNLPENQNIDKSHFVVVVCQPENDFATNIESAFRGINLPIQTIFTTQKYSAMAGSDSGLVYNGEIVSECAAMQLPAAILENMNFAQHYYMQMYNNWNNDLNIAKRGEMYQELIGTAATPYRISEELQRMQDPKLRYYLAQQLERTLYNMVPKHVDQGENAITQGDQTFVKHGFTYQTMASKILKAANAYHASEKKQPHYKLAEVRQQALKSALA